MLRQLFTLALTTAQVVTALPAALQSRDVTGQTGYISVSVATVWTNSGKVRPDVDGPALTNPVGIAEWLGAMSKDQFLDLTSSDRTQTQALLGNEVTIKGEAAGWYEVEVHGQPTGKDAVGYPGWIPAAQISLDSAYGDLQAKRPFVLVDAVATTQLYRDVLLTTPYVEISYGTRLPVIVHLGLVVQVAVPGGGSAYIKAAHSSVYTSASKIPYPTGADLVKAGKLFIGRPYLWGGASGFGMDCSGFTSTIYHAHGLIIARDAGPQANLTGPGVAQHVKDVTPEELQAGDLLYYGSNKAKASSIHHVAMYAGDGMMLEAYGAGTPVRLTEIRLGGDYWGAQRFLSR
jgi:cell wall-associated NlpC family hydrolase